MFYKIFAVLLFCLMPIAFSTLRADAETNNPPTVGLALSGGAALGMAHIGVLEVLEDNGITFDIITGTSAGAIVGALYSGGMSPKEMVKLAGDLTWSEFVTTPALLDLGLFSTEGIQEFIAENLPEDNFTSLSQKLAVVATDLDTGERIVINQGSISKAVGASAAIPVVFNPVEYEGRLLVDGGLADNLPDTLAREMGADIVIAINVNSGFMSTEKPQGKIEVGIRAYNIMMMHHSRAVDADVLIKPNLDGISGTDFDSYQELISRGREAAKAVLSDILDVLDA